LVGFLLGKLSGVSAIVFSIVLMSLPRDKISPGLKTVGKNLMDGLMLNRGKDRLEGRMAIKMPLKGARIACIVG